MHIVIDIPEVFYEVLKKADEIVSGPHSEKALMSVIYNAIAKGTPLPKGHGRLIDISQIDKDKIESSNPVISLMLNDEYIEAVSLDYLSGLPTIVEADAESEVRDVRQE